MPTVTAKDTLRRAAARLVADASERGEAPDTLLVRALGAVVSPVMSPVASPNPGPAPDLNPQTTDELTRAIDEHREPALPNARLGTHRALALGLLHEHVLAEAAKGDRRQRGAFYTPGHLVEFVLDRVGLGPEGDPAPIPMICDPACGGGAFLVGALERLAHRRPEIQRADLLGHVAGVDLDPVASEIAALALWVWAGDPTIIFERARRRVRTADALLGDLLPPHPTPPDARLCWDRVFPEAFDRDRPGFDAVVGNPPFLGQLSGDTARDRATAKAVRDASNGRVARYADTAAAFWELGSRLTRPGGRLGLVLPASILATADAAGVRRALAEAGALESLWTCDEPVFSGTPVRVCVPTIVRTATAPRSVSEVRRWTGSGYRATPAVPIDPDRLRSAETWAQIVRADRVPAAHALRVYDDPAPDRVLLGDVADCSADFRDEYYALAGHVEEHHQPETARPGHPAPGPEGRVPVITCGLIDPGVTLWGRATTRLHKQRWTAPCVRRDRLDDDPVLARYARRRLVPKILVATQTRVIEGVADPGGLYLPSTPVLTVVPHNPETIWLLLAALLSPVCSALGLTRYQGAALSPDAIKLSATQLAKMPLPAHPDSPGDQWRRAASLVREADRSERRADVHERLTDAARATTHAYGVVGRGDGRLTEWWRGRLPVRAAS